MQVYFPTSAGPASTMMSSWLAAAKKWRSVSTRGPSSLVQLRRGAGLPPAIHWSTAVSPRATVLSSSGRMKDGVSGGEQVYWFFKKGLFQRHLCHTFWTDVCEVRFVIFKNNKHVHTPVCSWITTSEARSLRNVIIYIVFVVSLHIVTSWNCCGVMMTDINKEPVSAEWLSWNDPVVKHL